LLWRTELGLLQEWESVPDLGDVWQLYNVHGKSSHNDGFSLKTVVEQMDNPFLKENKDLLVPDMKEKWMSQSVKL
jgi:hypothetical protein